MSTQTIPSLSEQLRKLDFIMGAVTRGLTYKEASALWADGIDQLYDRMVD
jgi:flagellin-specific chaperone FliS